MDPGRGVTDRLEKGVCVWGGGGGGLGTRGSGTESPALQRSIPASVAFENEAGRTSQTADRKGQSGKRPS